MLISIPQLISLIFGALQDICSPPMSVLLPRGFCIPPRTIFRAIYPPLAVSLAIFSGICKGTLKYWPAPTGWSGFIVGA